MTHISSKIYAYQISNTTMFTCYQNYEIQQLTSDCDNTASTNDGLKTGQDDTDDKVFDI